MGSLRHLPLVLVLAAVGCAPAVRGDVIALRFWAGDGARNDPRVVEVVRHCCCTGDVAVARVAALPRPGAKNPLEPERVVEVNVAGTIIRRWSMPVDSIVTAVTGEQIVVSLASPETPSSRRGILVSPGGTVTLTDVPRSSPEPMLGECPDSLTREFGQSAYLRCFTFRDLETGDLRRIAFQGPCT
jgi:hypothetical protein